MKALRMLAALGFVTLSLASLTTCKREPAIDLTGYWDHYITPKDQPEMFTGPFYILQKTDSSLDCSMGITGSISGHTVTLDVWMGGNHYIGTATVSASGNEITGSFADSPFGPMTMRMVRSTLPFGRLDLEGSCQGVPISVHTDYGLGRIKEPAIPSFMLSYTDNMQSISLSCNFADDFNVGTYQMPMEAWVTLLLNIETNPQVQGSTASGTLEIKSYSVDHIEGSMTVNFSEGGTITGTFNVSLGEYGF